MLRVPPGEIDRDPALGMRAAAALLRRAAGPVPPAADAPLESWRPALERFAGGADSVANALYADGVLRAAARGIHGVDGAGEAIDVPPRAARAIDVLGPRAAPDGVVGVASVPFWPAAAAAHRPLARNTARRVRFIVIHTAQNSFAWTFEFFRRPGTRVASHYLVRAADGLAVQLVDERLVAFHDACFNQESIGIEHEGYVASGERWYSDELYRASAALVRDIAARHGIPLDRAHILGHGETPDCSDHADPGDAWDWDRFMAHVRGE
jgi:hypothetical protein